MQKKRSLLSPWLIPLLIGFILISVTCQKTASSELEDGASILGTWYGYATLEENEILFSLEFSKNSDGKLAATVSVPDWGTDEQPLTQLSYEDGILMGRADDVSGTISGRLDEETSRLELELNSDFITTKLSLKRDDGELASLQAPRTDETGEQELDYTYASPEKVDDGWDISNLADEGLNTALIEELIRTCLDGKSFPKTDSVLVARNGKLVLEEYFHRQTREKPHTIQSVTKSVTSMLVGIAIERGEIEGVDQLVYPIFPEYKGKKWIDEEYDIVLKDVLTMTGGLDWDESSIPYTDDRNDNVAMNNSDDWFGYVFDKGRAFKPGEKFVYCSGLSILLGGIIKNSTGMYVDEYAEKYLFGPLGISAYSWFKSPKKIFHTGGGLSLRPRDMLKLGQVMLNGGTWNGKRILPEKWAKDSLKEHTRRDEKIQYGYQWWLHTFKAPLGPVKTAMGKGYGGQFIMIAPTLNLVAVTTALNFKGAGKSWEKKFSDYILPAAQ
ncbi:serine hydrolase domain-containing protein [Acidobacteriota bacterium]